jgi:uroporphyrin-III C-methyltransferase
LRVIDATIGSGADDGNRQSQVATPLSLRHKSRHNRDMDNAPPLPGHDWPVMQPGWVWLCGAGPGDPGLLTLHALNALRQADVVIYDALVQETILDWAPQADLIYAGKRGGKPSAKQRDISLRLVDLARAGKRVLRLKGGDPFVFGRGGEEAQTLVQHGVPIRIIPGISAGIGGLAYAGIPVTHRDVNQSVTFVTGHDQSGNTPGNLDWTSISKGSQVIVIYMGMKHIAQIAGHLIAAGRSLHEPVAVVTTATTQDQHVLETTLGTIVDDIAAARLEPPAIICVGQSVLMRQVLDWQGMAAGAPARNLDPLGRGRAAESA